MKTSWWLIKITIPVSFGVFLMDFYGLLDMMAQYTGPVFNTIGLPGTSAIVLITSIFTNIYSVVAVLTTLNLPMREGVIIGTMCLVSHNFIIETTVLQKTGSSVWRMLFLRLIGSFIIGWFLNLIIPGSFSNILLSANTQKGEFVPLLINWCRSISLTTAKIIILVVLLLVLQQVMEEFNLIRWIEKALSPLLKLMGLPTATAISWTVANTIGLAYGAAIMINQVEEGKLRKQDADLLNHHVALSHSQLEDPLLFLAVGYAIHWMIWPRILIAILAVWIRRLEISIRNRNAINQ
jgi:spore maturation protein SpmB